MSDSKILVEMKGVKQHFTVKKSRGQKATLYAVDGGRGADITKGEQTVQVLRDEGEPDRVTVRVTVEVLDPEQDYAVTGTEEHDFLYEQVGDQWIFTTFSAVR